ncbi:hypothetical protein [Bacteroides stercoris]|uniref:hypothetical protein n=1 Tax=Bacteroides stercoris TaxID=46506 RepID=UPI00189E677C|nr:hypothetical protein [Bacteroides stercoris]
MDRIKTKLKFTKSTVSGSWVGFISINTKTGKIKGVREDAEEPKCVCIASRELEAVIEPDVLYDVQMIPMTNNRRGFIVVAAEPHAFEAKITSTVVKNAIYKVEVKFGNKTIIYDPMDGERFSIRTISGVIKQLAKRKDIKNLLLVIEDFRKAANIVLTVFQNDGHYVPTNKVYKTAKA